MRATAIVFLVLALGCGSVKDRDSCGTSTDCAAGSYCARTPDGNVCWPDAVAPSVASVAVSCPTPCLRDGTLHVTANVADDAEVLSADVSLDGASTVALGNAGGGVWSGSVQLARVPFPYFEHGFQVKVTARDGARNVASLDAAGVATVTRLRFSKQIDGVFGMTSPAVMQDGTVVVAGTNGKTYFVSWDGAAASSLAVGTAGVSAAPLVQGESVWIGSEDNRLYEVANQAGTWQATSRCDTTRPIRGSLAASHLYVFATSDIGRVFSANSSACLGNSSRRAAMSLGPVIDFDGSLYAISGTFLRRLTVDDVGVPDDDPAFSATTLGSLVFDPIVANTGALLVTVPGAQGRMLRASPLDPQPQFLGTTQVPSSGAIVLRDAAIVLPGQNQKLAKWPAAGGGAPTWESADLGGYPRTPLAMISTGEAFVVSTDNGFVHALRSDGSVTWSSKLSPGTAALQPANIYTPPPAQQLPGTTLSTAYFAGADGYLHAVIVDGALDGAAPWPKAFHDPKNTNRAGPQP